MTELYDLKEKLCKELKEFGKKDKIDAATLDVVDKLAHALKNVCKIIDSYESENMPEYDTGYSYSRVMPPRMSFARGRGAKRDSMGRYSRNEGGYSTDDGFRMEMQEMIQNAPNDYVRQKIMEAMNGM